MDLLAARAPRVLAFVAAIALVASCGLDWSVGNDGGEGDSDDGPSTSTKSGGSNSSPASGGGGAGASGSGVTGGDGGAASAASSAVASTVGAGGAGGDGGAPTCESANVDCAGCATCAEAGSCAAQLNACLVEDFCACLYDCRDDTCASFCEIDYTDEGLQRWDALGFCVVCSECPSDCGEFFDDWCS